MSIFLLFQSFLGGFFGPICEIDVVLNDGETRKMAEMKTEDGKVEKHYLFYDGESVSGKNFSMTRVILMNL
uniref:VPS26, retromer complex component A n=1 Tax=Suricata suricatta TaxID=37032 RepID=A0A673UFK6_SURSU